MLRTSLDLGNDAGGLELLAHDFPQRFDVPLARHALFLQGGGDAVIFLGLEIAEREILELPFELARAQPVGERSEHHPRLEREPFASGAGLVPRQPQARQLLFQAYYHRTWVVRDSEQHLAHGFCLARIEAALRRPVARQCELTGRRQHALVGSRA